MTDITDGSGILPRPYWLGSIGRRRTRGRIAPLEGVVRRELAFEPANETDRGSATRQPREADHQASMLCSQAGAAVGVTTRSRTERLRSRTTPNPTFAERSSTMNAAVSQYSGKMPNVPSVPRIQTTG